jgi:hypothetical protein
MIAPLLALALAAAPPDPVLDADRAYSQCLDGVMRKDLREKRTQARFEQDAARGCGATAGSLRTVLIADDLASGVSRAQAEANADTEIRHMLDLAKVMFADYRTRGLLPYP